MPKPFPLDMDFPGSSAIVRARYRPEMRQLDLWWRASDDDEAGRGYAYLDVPPEKWRALLKVHEAGGSVGEYANRQVKDLHEVAPLEIEA
ncbi:MAG TPA: KTSC domain-containing protein [Allosphingosinicella sp.]|jgi:hypothetical protein|nr:KTSC domain-containing protein [Allosphingosinicella sp.]